MKIKYRLFKIWKKQQYKKFLKEANWDFDHSSITSFLELKLTIMGLYFAKFGIVVDEDRKSRSILFGKLENIYVIIKTHLIGLKNNVKKSLEISMDVIMK